MAPPASREFAISCEAVRANLPRLLQFAVDATRDAGLDETTAQSVRLAIEEACINVIDHGYAGASPGPIEVSIRSEATHVTVRIADRAPRFAPQDVAVPDAGASADERPIGGLGWFLIGQVMDEVSHEYTPAAGNRLTLVRYFDRETGKATK